MTGLQRLAAAHPLRERFHAQLMLALYRCGRQADALAAYRNARRLLVEDRTTLAAGDMGGTLTLWNAGNPAQPRQLSHLTISNGNSVAFSPDGTLAAGGSGAVQVWRDASYAISRICDLTAGTPTPQQWHQYIPQLPYNPPCSR